MTLYQQIKRHSRGTLEHYQTDLTAHDRHSCASMKPGTSALWTVRNMGTHFVWVNHGSDEMNRTTLESLRCRLNYFDAVASVFGNEDGSDTWYMLECLGKAQNGTSFKLSANDARDIMLRRIKSYERELERRAA